MIVFMTLAYVAVLFVLIKLKVLPNTKATWLSTIVWVVVLFIFLFIPMQWGAPSGRALSYQPVIEVIPNVWSAIGATAPPTYENAGHNNNLSFIITGDGVVVVNGGAAARAIGSSSDRCLTESIAIERASDE